MRLKANTTKPMKADSATGKGYSRRRRAPRADGRCGFCTSATYDPCGVHLFNALDEDVRAFLMPAQS